MVITIHSGGAMGADSCFGNIGTKYGHEVIHHSFANHKIYCNGKIIKHTNEELFIADSTLLECNKKLKRQFPTNNDYVNNLLRRNYFQVINSNIIIAIAQLENKYIVKGGTGWAVEMGILLNKPVAVFDDNKTNMWYKYNSTENYFQPMENKRPALRHNCIIAGIGTRNISNKGIIEIESILKN